MSALNSPKERQPIDVMVVEDNVDFADNLAEILSQQGMSPRIFHDLTSAKLAFDQYCPDICFVDLRLPDGDGELLVAELSERSPLSLSIVLTANASMKSAISVVNAGAFGFLLKDMPVSGILTCFRRACERIDLQRENNELEARLRHQEQLAMIGQMSATLAHEIKNPLTGISQALEVLLESVGEPPELAGLKASILTRFRAMNDLVEDLLEFSKPLNVKCNPKNVELLLEDIENELRTEGSLLDTEITKTIDPEASIIHVDEVHFRMLLRNLYRNADQAMKGAQRKHLDVKSQIVNQSFRLVFADNGPGIPADAAKKVFQPFFTTKTRGTGLGLALAVRIVEAHSGNITVRNSRSGGAEFMIELDHKG